MKRVRSLGVALAAVGMASSGPPTPQERMDGSASAGVGRVLDREGGAARRGVLARRWGPAEAGTTLAAGDWLEVPSRGANALKVRLSGGAELILGPETLVELASAERITLAHGEIEVELPERIHGPVEVVGPADTTIRVERRAVLRAHERQLVRLDQDPRWLSGYETNASTEALGSLLANVDGRNVPLTIGYHKVTVDVRDQIARTVIEESFVNHTHSILEGVFYFPLPADASISGFGMWIGNELVQGDIVEKQRAREIYETILRERRDPGLLEWTGGNIFKARVYPIGDEKRIRIAYTQVLLKEGDTFAYHYALQSELLRKTPLERLEIEVNISSTQPLEAVTCPSHVTRIRATEHAAKVEFAAEEFAPERDFELRVKLKPSEERITVIPHRRGDDGYFMLLVDAPPLRTAGDENGSEAAQPLEILVLADTSGSMWGAPRANQMAFVENLIAALGEDDTFNLATCDVDTSWAFERPLGNTLANRERALAFLEERDPLGWTDLGRAFAAARDRASANTHVVYVGDGVPTSGSADPIELAHELGGPAYGTGTLHAVVPGSGSEMAVLRALAGIGGGSVRSIGGGTDPTQTAFALLKEIGAPALENLELHFEGLAVAAVYPERLPNLPAGGQQVVVGRFDPTGGDLAGRVRLTARLGGEELRFERELRLLADLENNTALQDADESNSFIPRLWARRHLDHLLDQGPSERAKERIIALSEDFQIVTPYTSFLVLESDEDRERFGVEKRFRVRDGEEFFAAGRDDARHQLVREQMLAARSWRRELQSELLRSLAGMGRGLTEWLRNSGFDYGQALALGALDMKSENRYARGGGNGGGNEELRFGDQFARRDKDDGELEDRSADEGFEGADDEVAEEPLLEEALVIGALERRAMNSAAASGTASSADGFFLGHGQYRGPGDSVPLGYNSGLLGGRANNARHYSDPFEALFPALDPPPAGAPELGWPAEVLEVLQRIDRRPALASSGLAWRFAVEITWSDAHGRSSSSGGSSLIAPDRWVTVSTHLQGHQYRVDWMHEGQRGALMEGWRLGRVRTAKEADASSWSAPFAWTFGDAIRQYASYEARLVRLDGGRIRLDFWLPSTPKNTLSLEIDVERGLVLEQFHSANGERTSGQTFADFHELGGLWWPRTIRPWSQDQRDEGLTRIEVETPSAAEFARLAQAELARRDDAILLGKEPRLAQAKQAVAQGAAGLEERWLLLRHFARTQRWSLAEPHFHALIQLAAEKPGRVPIRLVWLQQSRRQEELRLTLLEHADELVGAPRDAEYGLALQLLGYANGLNPGNEVLALLAAIHPVFLRQPATLDAEWDARRLQALANLDRPEELFVERKSAAVKWPHNLGMQTAFATLLAKRGEVDQALAWLATVEAENGPWDTYQRMVVRNATLQIFWDGYRLEQLVETFAAWEREDPVQLDSGVAGQYLSALTFLDREREAWAKTEAWLELATIEGLASTDTALLQAAIQYALGQGHNLYHQRVDDQHAERLAMAARRLAHGDDPYLAGWVLQNWAFRNSDAGVALLAEVFGELEQELEEFDAGRLQRWFQWLRFAGIATGADEEAWQALLERVFQRWLATDEETERAALGQTLLTHAATGLRVRTLRESLARSVGESKRIEAATLLYQELLQQPWSAETERELVSLLSPLALAETAGKLLSSNLDRRVLAIYELVNWIRRARTEAIVTALPGYETMSRRTLASERAKALHMVRDGAATLLDGLERTLVAPELRDWAGLERFTLEIEAKRGLDAAWDRSLGLLTRGVDALVGAGEADDVPLRDRILTQRCIATCTFLLLSSEEANLAERELALRAQFERLIASDAETHGFPEGRSATRDLLIALDRGGELESVLSSWFDGGAEFVKIRWGSDYAHVLAERGELARAAEVLEEIERIDELAERDLGALADWYTALDQRARAREARIRSFQVLREEQLANDLYQRAQLYQRHGDEVPPELDPEIPLRFVALMRKAIQPQIRLGILHRFYEATKDFRLLECLPDVVIGQSAENIYPFLDQMGNLAALIDEEATVERIQSQLAELREGARTDVDRRALSLLQFQILLKAGRQANGTERHAERALGALREAFPGEWVEGEPGLLAGFLATQGRLEPQALATEQLRQLRALRSLATDPDERFAIAQGLAQTLWAYSEHDQAVQALEGALNERRGAAGGRLPPSTNDGLQRLSSWHVSLGSFRRAEETWLGELEAGHPEQQALWLRELLFEVYRDALLGRGELSLGRGDGLYSAVVEAILLDLSQRTNEQHASQVVSLLTQLWQRAHQELHLARVPEDLSDFAFAHLPAVLDLYQCRNGQQMVASVAEALSKVRGPMATLEFLVVRAENEPRWLRLQSQGFWQQHAGRLGNALREAGKLGESLDQRILSIVLDELGDDLRSRQKQNRSVYDERYGNFWREKRADFLRTTQLFLEQHRDSPLAIAYAAEYLFRGLSAHSEAIDSLFGAYRRGNLHLEGRDQLATYLQERERWAESIPLVVELIEERPAEARQRVMLMLARFHTGDSAALTRAFGDAENWFRREKRWTEPVIATLGNGCLGTELLDDCVRLFGGAIALHVRTAPKRGVGDGVLCTYYRGQSGGYTGLGRTDDAVDAAAGAIVSWGPDIAQRGRELANLVGVLEGARDLEAYVGRLDAEVEATGLENPILRKALGQLYLKRENHAAAAAQLARAARARPDDTEVRQMLLGVYDGQHQPELAAEALLEWSRTAGHELARYIDLGRRYLALERNERSERALTTVVELSAQESEGHRLLAEAREAAERWAEAAEQWRHVTRTRTNEPEGYIRLARALIRLQRLDEARDIVDHLRTTSWPARFGDMRRSAELLLEEIRKRG